MKSKLSSADDLRYQSRCAKEQLERGIYTFEDDSALLALVKDCTKERDLLKGSRLHADIARRGLLAKSIFIGSTIIDMYSKCGALSEAQGVLDELPVRDTVAWNALIAGYAQHNRCEDALNRYMEMQHEGLFPDPVTFACIFKACGNVVASEKGEWIHAEVLKYDFLAKHLVVANALVDMYVKCGALAKGRQLFDEIPARDVVSWTALITGYCQHEHYQEALTCYERMQHEGLSPNAVTFASALKACASLKAVVKGQEIHCEIAAKGLLRQNIILDNALMAMYARCGALVQAREVFNGLCVRNVASWAGLIAGYCQHGHGNKAIFCFEQMKKEGFSPNAMTFSTILKVCGSVGAVEKGLEIHSEIARKGLIGNSTALGNALIDMYGKCGVLAKAQEVFDNLPVYDVVSWTALIAGYCEHGQGEEAVDCFEGMKQKGFSPDAITYSCLLKACSNIGETEKGQTYFETLSTRYGVIPSLQHVTKLVVLSAQQGHFDKMMELLKRMPCFDCLSTVINACQQWGNAELGRLAFDNVMRSSERAAVSEVFISQIMEVPIVQKWFASKV
ncbi:hypothetical protein GOP47_0026961 [Adiantum capillus-veneris]|nr:hypothetical protein GOP47_0026961 [Adiantum capillus-veneris]